MEFLLKVSQEYQNISAIVSTISFCVYFHFLFQFKHFSSPSFHSCLLQEELKCKKNILFCWLLRLWDTMLSSKHSFVDHLGKNCVFLLKKPFFLIWMGHGCLLAVRQMLGDSPPGEQLWSTLWGLNYSFRMATCIQLALHRGEDFTSHGSALLDSLPWKTVNTKVRAGKGRADYDDSVLRGVKHFMIGGLFGATDASDLQNAGVYQEAWASYGAPYWWKLGRISSLKKNKEAVMSALRRQ